MLCYFLLCCIICDALLIAFCHVSGAVGWAIKELSACEKNLLQQTTKILRWGLTLIGLCVEKFAIEWKPEVSISLRQQLTTECTCYRKLHKDEIRQQKQKALNKSADTDSGSDMEIDSGFSVPGRIWNKLYR